MPRVATRRTETERGDTSMTVMVGESVPELTRELGAAVLMAYGAATWDWHRLHYDQRYVEAHGPMHRWWTDRCSAHCAHKQSSVG